MSRKTLIAIALTLAWLLAMAAAFWWYQLRYIRPFDNQTMLFDGHNLRLPLGLAGPGPIRLVHFLDPKCPCNVGNQQHLASLIERFSGHGVAFYVAPKSGKPVQLPKPLTALKPIKLAGTEDLPASPAVALWDQNGQLAYFGPYSEGATCTSANSFVEPIIEALLAGRSVKVGNNLAVGCFCNWAQ